MKFLFWIYFQISILKSKISFLRVRDATADAVLLVGSKQSMLSMNCKYLLKQLMVANFDLGK